MEDVSSVLNQYIATEIARQPQRILAPDEPLLTSGLIDSFHLVDLALFVEDRFGVHLDDAELNAQTFDTLAQLVSLVESRR